MITDFEMAPTVNTDCNFTGEINSDVENRLNIETTSLTMTYVSNERYEQEKDICFKNFDNWSPEDQIDFIEDLLLRMTHFQHGHINTFLKPMLQRDFISALPGMYQIYMVQRKTKMLFKSSV